MHSLLLLNSLCHHCSILPTNPPLPLPLFSCGNFENLVESKSMLPLPPLSNISNITDDEVRVLKEVDAFLYNQLITRRNRRMARKLNVMLQSQRNEVYYVALGAGMHVLTLVYNHSYPVLLIDMKGGWVRES